MMDIMQFVAHSDRNLPWTVEHTCETLSLDDFTEL